jgi:alanine dehydrogenase
VGTNAAKMFHMMGADLYVLDSDLRKLQAIEHQCWGARTMVAYDFNVARVVKLADVLVGAVLIPGARTPKVVTREMVCTMKPRSVIMDVSIDQGGCVETSRPTTYQNPTYIEEGVIHYCVPNMTGVLARTTTHAFNNAAWPYIQEIAAKGLDQAILDDVALRRGLNVHMGEIVHPALLSADDGVTGGAA